MQHMMVRSKQHNFVAVAHLPSLHQHTLPEIKLTVCAGMLRVCSVAAAAGWVWEDV